MELSRVLDKHCVVDLTKMGAGSGYYTFTATV